MAARYLSQKRGPPASWPAPFCVSACFRGVSTPRLRPVRPSCPADDPPLSLSLSLSLFRHLRARTRAFVPARGSFVNFVVSCTSRPERSRLRFLGYRGPSIFKRCPPPREANAVPRVRNAKAARLRRGLLRCLALSRVVSEPYFQRGSRR